MIPSFWHKNGWRSWHVPTGLALAAIGVLITHDAWADIVRIALRDEESSHVFLVPAVAAWLVWVRRSRFQLCRPRGMFIGPAIVAIGWLIGSIGYNFEIQAFWHSGAVLVVVGCVLSVLGCEVLVRFLPAFLALAFLVPVPGMLRQQVAIPLQSVTAQLTHSMCIVFGVAVDRAGNVLNINGVDVAIAEACNGLRMVFALILVSYAYAFGSPLRSYLRVLITVASPLCAIFCNVLRMTPTLWLYGHYPTAVAERFHDFSSWLMLMLAFLLLVGIIRLLVWARIPVAPYNLAYD